MFLRADIIFSPPPGYFIYLPFDSCFSRLARRFRLPSSDLELHSIPEEPLAFLPLWPLPLWLHDGFLPVVFHVFLLLKLSPRDLQG